MDRLHTTWDPRIVDCEDIPIEQLYEAGRKIEHLGLKENTLIRNGTALIEQSRIPWANIQYLYIQGDLTSDVRWGMHIWSPGAYINKAGNWLLIVLDGNSPEPFQPMIARLGPKLEVLSIQRNFLGNRTNPVLSHLSVNHLTGLQELTLRDECCLKSLNGLGELSGLVSLTIHSCMRLESLSGIEQLRNLKELRVSHCYGLTELPSFSNLGNLKSLRLSVCGHAGFLSGLDGLTSLTHMDLTDCKSVTTLTGLEKLTQLEYLNLRGCENLCTLPDLDALTMLPHLNIGDCINLDLPSNYAFPPNIKALNLENTAINHLPDTIKNLRSLRNLNLQSMHLADLPDWLSEIAEEFSLKHLAVDDGTGKAIVYLGGTFVDGVDMSIFDQPYSIIAQWFEERKKGRTLPLNEIKVIFLGDGEAGKSYTISRLMNNGGEALDYKGVRTPGIDIKAHPCAFEGRNFTVNYWDFGGQEVMHSMHRIFLTNRTMYVVLVNASDPDPDGRAQYWLNNIKSFAPNAPILLALNKVDIAPHVSLSAQMLMEENSNLTQVVRLSSFEYDEEQFDREFRQVLLREIVKSGILDVAWPKSWIEVKNRMEHYGKNHMPIEDYEAICRACQVEDLQMELLHWFNDLGVSFCFRDSFKLKRQIILQPKWITNGLYIILFNACKGVINGMVPHESIHDMLEMAPHDRSIKCTDRSAVYQIPRDAEYVLGIMRKFGLSFQAYEDREFIPMLCQQQSTLNVSQLHQDENVLEFHMEFEYLPNNLLYRLMVERYAELDKANVWKSGARFVQPGTGLSAVVTMDSSTLKFYLAPANHTHRSKTYLVALKAHADRIREDMSLQPPEEVLIYKHGGQIAAFDYEELKHALRTGIQEVYSKVFRGSIPVLDILLRSGVEELPETEAVTHRGTYLAEPRKSKRALTESVLLDYIIRSCRNIQAEPSYGSTGDRSGKENLRNRRIRDDLSLRLEKTGYHITDQSERGRSGTGQNIGELDLFVVDETDTPLTIIEALRVCNTTKSNWKEHLTKLLGSYNYPGLRFVYLITYVDGNETVFKSVMEKYPDYIQKCNPGNYKCKPETFRELNTDGDLQYIRTFRCDYTCGIATVTVYHLFVMVKPQPPQAKNENRLT